MGDNVPKDVFSIIEEEGKPSRWFRIGNAFVNKDGSINAFLDAYPKDGKIQIRERRFKENNGGQK